MRRQKPDCFNSKIRPFFEAPKMFTYDDDAKILNVNIQFLDISNANNLVPFSIVHFFSTSFSEIRISVKSCY